MSSGYWQGLRPFEKRVVVGAGVLFFVVLNLWLVIPHFSDLGAMQLRMQQAQDKLLKYNNEIAQTNIYNKALRELERGGLDVPAEEQAYQFANAVNSQAGQSGIRIVSNGRINTQTNQFFLEKSQNIQVQGGEKQLVDFLYNLGSGASLIRVRDLSMRPDPPRHELLANVTLVASFQKRSTARPAASPKIATSTTKRP